MVQNRLVEKIFFKDIILKSELNLYEENKRKMSVYFFWGKCFF